MTATDTDTAESQWCQCDEPEPAPNAYDDPRTSRTHRQMICEKCGDPIKNPDNGRMMQS